MGVILRVWDKDLKRQLALKQVKGFGTRDQGLTPADESRLMRFVDEFPRARFAVLFARA